MYNSIVSTLFHDEDSSMALTSTTSSFDYADPLYSPACCLANQLITNGIHKLNDFGGFTKNIIKVWPP